MASTGTNSARGRSRVLASPRARRLLRQSGVKAEAIKGSGPRGRIVEADVKAAAQRAAPGVNAVPAPVSLMRRTIAERTTLSFSTTPHFYLRVEADVTELVTLQNELAQKQGVEGQVKVTLTDFLLWSMGQTVAKFPFSNCVWQNQGLWKLSTIDLGLVVSLPDGLLVPVLRNADKLTIFELAKRRAELTATAQAGKLTAAEMQGGAMSLSNLGTKRVDDFMPVIAPHQSSMLAVGRAAHRPFVVDNRVVARTTMRLCLAVDHRVMDGAPAADVLGSIVDMLEHPRTMTL